MNRFRNQLLRARFARMYLIAISIVCIFLLVFSIVSLLQQHVLFDSFSDKSLRLEGETLAIEIERRALQLAQACLTDPAIQNAARLPAGLSNPGKLAESPFATIRKDHPIAGYFFVMQDGQLLFPRPAPPASQARTFETAASPAEKKFAALFQAGVANSHKYNLQLAIAAFETCMALEVDDDWKARAQLRLAYCYKEAKRPTDAVRAFGYLRDHYSDYVDDSSQPYAVTAALEMDSLVQDRAQNIDALSAAYQQLAGGRWQSSEIATERLKKELKRRLGDKAPAQEPRYIDRFKVARAVETELRRVVSDPHKRFQRVVPADPLLQLFGLVLPAHNGHNLILAFTVDEVWLREQLLEDCRNSLAVHYGPVPAFKIRAKSSLPSAEPVMSFWTVVPFLELYLPSKEIYAAQTNMKAQLWLAAGSAALMGCLLYLVIILIVRVNRELNSIHLQNDFLARVTHELKTPLTMILLYNETLIEDERLDPQKRCDFHKIIAREGERLKRLIENLLLVSRHEKKKPDYRLATGDLGATVDQTVRACAGWLESMGFEITMDLVPNLPPVRFDSEKVTQALMNLLDNARKYSGQARKIDISLYPEGSCIILAVRDYGPGIPAEERKNIFEKYYRATDTGGASGVGLGLFIVREIIQAHGGAVEVDAAEPHGTTFRLSFSSSGIPETSASTMGADEARRIGLEKS